MEPQNATKSVLYNYTLFSLAKGTAAFGTDAGLARQYAEDEERFIPGPTVITANINPTSALGVLRARTRELHQQIESGIDLGKLLSTREGYCNLLAAYLSLYRPYEAALAKAPAALRALVEYPESSRVVLLEQDLRQLNKTKAEIEDVADAKDLPDLSDRNAMLGALYVIEGSQLGGQMIYRDIRAKLSLDIDSGASFFGGAGEHTGARWKQFLAGLEEQITDPDRAADAACAMFHYFGKGLAAAAPSGEL